MRPATLIDDGQLAFAHDPGKDMRQQHDSLLQIAAAQILAISAFSAQRGECANFGWGEWE
jgi:hypothetical protein